MKKTAWLLGMALALGAGHALAATDAMKKAGCTACHAQDKKMVGPSYNDVAAKYKGQDVTAKLMEKVRKGGKGVFGPIPMPPNPASKINDADLKAAIESILKG